MKGKMIGDKVALRIKESEFGKIKVDTPNGTIEIQIDTGYEKAHYHTQFSEVVNVSDAEQEIKIGMMVFHNHNVFSEGRFMEKDTYWTPREFIFGTETQMFGDYCMVERLYEDEDSVIGTVFSPEVKSHSVPIKNKCRILSGSRKGTVMYCTDLMFYEIVGYSRKVYIAREKQLICDEQMNPVKDKVIVKIQDNDFVVRNSGVIVNRNFTRPNSKRGTVLKAYDKIYEGKDIAYSRFEKFYFNGELLHSVEEKNIDGVFEDVEQIKTLS